jgi:Domain of unknown function (DUF3303)
MRVTSSGRGSRISLSRVKRRATPHPGYENKAHRVLVMLFMVIETFRNQDAKAVYRRFRDKGRQMPDGLSFVSSWVAADLGRCFQLMECDDITLLQKWIAEWSDLVTFEIIPVVSGKDTAAALTDQL